MKRKILRYETKGAILHHNFQTRRLPRNLTKQVFDSLDDAVTILEDEGHFVNSPLKVIRNPKVAGAYSAPLKLFVDLSDQCNLSCSHCLSSSSLAGQTRLSLETVEKIAKEAGDVGILYAKLGGGEPMMHPDVMRMVEAFNDNDLDVSISTNGTIMPRSRARALADLGVKVSVSFDGKEDTHNDIRGKTVYKAALNTLRKLQEAGVNVSMRATLFPFNFDDMLGLVDVAEQYGVQLKIRRAKPSGRTVDNELCILEPTQAYFDLLEYLNAQGDRVDIEDIMRFDTGYKQDLLIDERDCGAGTRSLHIDQYGNVNPCVFLGEGLRAGNIFEGATIMSEWRKAHPFKAMREIRMSEPCYDCSRVEKCHNECPAIKLYVTGKLDGHDPLCPRPYLTSETMEHTSFRKNRT